MFLIFFREDTARISLLPRRRSGIMCQLALWGYIAFCKNVYRRVKKFYLSAMVQPEPSPGPSTIRILHVDDEATQLDCIKKFLEMADESLKVESVASPEDARARAR